MKIIRLILGQMILFLDASLTPKPLVSRSAEAQAALDEKTKHWTMYQLETCPFCVKVRRHLKRMLLTIPFRDVARDSNAQKELMAGGKLDQVPCLRYIDDSGQVQWMYESSDINEFLTKIAN
jgi:glutaredoxin